MALSCFLFFIFCVCYPCHGRECKGDEGECLIELCKYMQMLIVPGCLLMYIFQNRCTGNPQCRGDDIICRSDHPCTIICNGDGFCNNAKFQANNASEFSLTCQGNSCRNAQTYCKTPKCEVTCGDNACTGTFGIYPDQLTKLLQCSGVNCPGITYFTPEPSGSPTNVPTNMPSVFPSLSPSEQPTEPSTNPTQFPTQNPSVSPTNHPTNNPTNTNVDDTTQNRSGEKDNSNSSSSSVPMIIGIAMGCICLLLCIGLIFVYLTKKNRRVNRITSTFGQQVDAATKQTDTMHSIDSAGSHSPIPVYNGPPPPEVKVQTHFDNGKQYAFKAQNAQGPHINQYQTSDVPAVPMVPMVLPSETGISQTQSTVPGPPPHQQPYGINETEENNSSDDDTVYKLQNQYAQEEMQSNGNYNNKSTMADIEESRSQSIVSDNTTLYKLQNRYMQQQDNQSNTTTNSRINFV